VTSAARKSPDAARGFSPTALLDACEKSEWAPLHALVLLAITTGARRKALEALRALKLEGSAR
jgi:hypothetical protein